MSAEAKEEIVLHENHESLVNSPAGPPGIAEGAEAVLDPQKTCDAEPGVSLQRQDAGELSPEVVTVRETGFETQITEATQIKDPPTAGKKEEKRK